MKALLLLLICAQPLFAFANGFVVTQSGRDAQGVSTFDRFEVTPDGLVKWQASASAGTDPLCNNGGGRYQGRIPANEVKALTGMALAALDEQPRAARDSAPEPRESTLHISANRGTKVRSGPVTRAGAQWKKLHEEVARVKRKLEPVSMVIMTAARKGGALSVRFTLLGDQPMTVLLSPKADETFQVQPASSLAYSAKLAKSELQLTKKKRTQTVSLRLSQAAVKEPAKLSYSNASILHHADSNFPLSAGAPELSLCTFFR
jgi:hypothetical protein